MGDNPIRRDSIKWCSRKVNPIRPCCYPLTWTPGCLYLIPMSSKGQLILPGNTFPVRKGAISTLKELWAHAYYLIGRWALSVYDFNHRSCTRVRAINRSSSFHLKTVLKNGRLTSVVLLYYIDVWPVNRFRLLSQTWGSSVYLWDTKSHQTMNVWPDRVIIDANKLTSILFRQISLKNLWTL